jgi:hypothetical protein
MTFADRLRVHRVVESATRCTSNGQAPVSGTVPTGTNPFVSGFSTEFKGALIGGAVAFLGLLGGVILVGNVGDFEALRLIGATLPTARFLASSTLTAGITVLALMLTLIGITYSSDLSFSELHYRRIKLINILSILVIVISVVVLVAMAIPIEEVDEVQGFYAAFYYILAALMSLLGGVIVSIALMIGSTVGGLVSAAHPEGSSSLIEADDSQDEETSEASA